MRTSYQIAQPIRNLQQLRAEKQNLQAHIQHSEQALKERIVHLPVALLVNVVQKFGSFVLKPRTQNSLLSLLGKPNNKPSLWKELLLQTALFAGKQLIDTFINKQQHGAAAANENFKET